jgi:hypothetical protein
MKNNKIKFLLENGVSKTTISKMTESQINALTERFKKSKKEESKEAVQVTNKTVMTADKTDLSKGTIPVPAGAKNLTFTPSKTDPNKVEIVPTSEGEVSEDTTNVSGNTSNVTSANAQGDIDLQVYTGQEGPHDANDEACDGMDDDSCNDRGNEGIAESNLNEKFESKAQQGLFWARCNKCSDKKCKWCKMAKEFSDSTSKKQYKDMPEKKHPEKTVDYKKKKTNEETQQYWENKILEMLEEEKKRKKSKKDSESFMLRKPKKMTMFSDEAPMELPIVKMFSIGKK